MVVSCFALGQLECEWANNRGEAEMPSEGKFYEEISVMDKAAYFGENTNVYIVESGLY